MPTPDDYDNPWKQALEQAFPEFVAFYFPDAARQTDWLRGHAFLDEELQQIARDAELGRRYADKLVSVFAHDGREDWICVHVEVQGLHDGAFARRMFVYNYRIFDRYDRPVASLAVLGDDDPHWRPDRFGFELLGCCHSLTYPVAKLIDREGELATLPADPNPFVPATVAHVLTRCTRDASYDRLVAKRRLVRLFYERNWSKTRILGFVAVLDWMMCLPDELETELWHDIESIEGERKVKYVTNVERLAIKRGIEQGIEQGLARGRQEGRMEGRVEGTLPCLPVS